MTARAQVHAHVGDGGWWSAPMVCAVAECTYRQLDYWARTGVVRPTIEASGSGTSRLYGEVDVAAVMVVSLLRSTVRLDVLADVANRLQSLPLEQWPDYAVCAGTAELVSLLDVVDLVHAAARCVALVPLGWVIATVRDRLALAR